MAKFQDTKNPVDDAVTASVLTSVAASGGQMTPELNVLIGLLAKRLQKEIGQEEEKERVARAVQQQNARQMEQQRKERIDSQNYCPHIKPFGGTALAGQRDHNRVVHLLCQYCQKEFDIPGNPPPAHLMPASDFIGGPNV